MLTEVNAKLKVFVLTDVSLCVSHLVKPGDAFQNNMLSSQSHLPVSQG